MLESIETQTLMVGMVMKRSSESMSFLKAGLMDCLRVT
jgi:hypothetical protein